MLLVTVQSGCDNDVAYEMGFIENVLNTPSRMTSWHQHEPATRTLLERYQPRIFTAPDSYLPISFYKDYLPRCVVRNRKIPRKVTHRNVNSGLLKKIQFDRNSFLDYQISAQVARQFALENVHPEIYGRIYADALPNDTNPINLLFLKYSLVFPYSGLPKNIGRLKKLGSHLIGDPLSWHELDIHGAIHIILNANTHRPIGVLLAQHNHHRVYLAGKDFTWPIDNRVSISFSQYSNEPYLMENDAPFRLERTVGNPMHIAYLFGATDKAPLGAGMDKVYSIIGGAKEVTTTLVLLPLDDPLYTAWIPLGNIEKIWGFWETWYRRGPPGIDFYTLGEIKNLADLTAFWYIDPNDEHFFSLLQESFNDFDNYDLSSALKHQRQRLTLALDAKMKS